MWTENGTRTVEDRGGRHETLCGSSGRRGRGLSVVSGSLSRARSDKSVVGETATRGRNLKMINSENGSRDECWRDYEILCRLLDGEEGIHGSFKERTRGSLSSSETPIGDVSVLEVVADDERPRSVTSDLTGNGPSGVLGMSTMRLPLDSCGQGREKPIAYLDAHRPANRRQTPRTPELVPDDLEDGNGSGFRGVFEPSLSNGVSSSDASSGVFADKWWRDCGRGGGCGGRERRA